MDLVTTRESDVTKSQAQRERLGEFEGGLMACRSRLYLGQVVFHCIHWYLLHLLYLLQERLGLVGRQEHFPCFAWPPWPLFTAWVFFLSLSIPANIRHTLIFSFLYLIPSLFLSFPSCQDQSSLEAFWNPTVEMYHYFFCSHSDCLTPHYSTYYIVSYIMAVSITLLPSSYCRGSYSNCLNTDQLCLLNDWTSNLVYKQHCSILYIKR